MLSRVSTGGELPLSYDLSTQNLPTQDVVFGRNNDCNVTLNIESLPLLISRKHATISLAGQILSIQDLGSTNGTYVNEQRLQPNQSRQLSDGDLLSFGGPKQIVREGQQHSNPFVYEVSAISSLTGQARPPRAARRAPHSSAAAGPSGEAAVDLTRTASVEAGPSDIVDLTDSPDLQVSNRHLSSARHHQERRVQLVATIGPHQQESRLQHVASSGPRQQAQSSAGTASRAHKSSRVPEAGHKRTRCIDISAQPALPEAAPAADAAAAIATQIAATGQIKDGDSAKQALENEFECTICRDFMVATHSVVPCGHMFCGECLSQWLQKKASCPKCRAAATGWVRTIAVDNVLESLVEKTMSPGDLEERKQRKKSWETNSAQISNQMKHVFRPGASMSGALGNRIGRGDAERFEAVMAAMPGFAGMMFPFGMQHHPGGAQHQHPGLHYQQHLAAHLHQYQPRHMPRPAAPQPPTNYTVAYNTDAHRVLCKNCRNPIVMNSLKIGFRDSNSVRWFHLGCLNPQRWQEAAMPGRLAGLPELPPAQQVAVRSFLFQRG